MENTEIIKALRWCGSEDERHEMCVDESYRCPMWNEDRITDECKAELMTTAADAFEADEKLIVELVKNIEHWKKDVVKLRSQLQKIKTQIYDLESIAKREYDDDPDNEYLEGYFDGLHQAAKELSTEPTVDTVQVVRCGECKHWIRNEDYSYVGRCELWNVDFENDFYCADGERIS